MCKQLFEATRSQGSRLWDVIYVPFSTAAELRSFAAWLQHCTCAPHTLILQVCFGSQGPASCGHGLWWGILHLVLRSYPHAPILRLVAPGGC